jgi:hypothetical protein
LNQDLADQEKSALSREISGLLFTAEATALSIPNRARILCLRIKTHAHQFSSAHPPLLDFDLIWPDYDELQSLLNTD